MSTTPSVIQGLPEGAVLKPIAPQTTVDSSQIQGLPAGATLKPINSGAPSSSGTSVPATQPSQPTLGDRIWEGAKQSAIGQGVQGVMGVLDAPKSSDEQVVHAIGGDPGLTAYRAAKSVVKSAQGMIKAGEDEYPQAKQDFQRAVQDFHSRDWRNAASSAASLGSDVIGITQPEMVTQMQNARELSEGARSGGNLATPLTRQAIDAATVLAPEIGDTAMATARSAASKASEAISPTAEVAGEQFATRPLRSKPNEAAGTKAVQNVAADVTKSAGATPTIPSSIRDVFDEPAQTIEANSKALYKQIDDATGGKFQPNADKLANVRLKIRDSSGIDPDLDDKLLAQKTRLEWQQEKMFDDAEANGVPRDTVEQARTLWKQKSALEDLGDIFNKKSNVSGPRPELVQTGVEGLPAEQYNFKGIANDINAMDPQRLKLALGKDGSQQLTTAVNLAAKKGFLASKFVKAVGSIALRVAGYGMAGEIAGHVLE
jgi:hypothetical protein